MKRYIQIKWEKHEMGEEKDDLKMGNFFSVLFILWYYFIKWVWRVDLIHN